MYTYFYYNKIRYTYENNKRMYYANDLLNYFGVPPFEEFLRTRKAQQLLYILSGKHVNTRDIYNIDLKRVVMCMSEQIRKDEWKTHWIVNGELLTAYYQWICDYIDNNNDYCINPDYAYF